MFYWPMKCLIIIIIFWIVFVLRANVCGGITYNSWKKIQNCFVVGLLLGKKRIFLLKPSCVCPPQRLLCVRV